ncbi:MFS transporter [Agarivorans sp. Toyoura001]|uniref:MFS transporter n=1 Tax=Agarivorans sp. Toyoura001 TaxID=2283141 RepID=UPI0010D682F8|nr:MFS transporter [Agarivorans sp. Toyoura001]GDY25028.1 MFS transporter [Agarivorans sp. Toyoura001]
MHNIDVTPSPTNGIFAPLLGLALFAVASGYFMSLLPLALASLSLPLGLSAWLASAYYTGLLGGALTAQKVISKMGHRRALALCLAVIFSCVLLMWQLPYTISWLALRFIAGAATADVFIIVESWLLLVNDDKQRASRLGIYMATLYAGNAFGQLLIEPFGISGSVPFLTVMVLLSLAILAPLLSRSNAPTQTQHQTLSFKAFSTLSKPAIIGCIVSGLILGPIYGLMPSYLSSLSVWGNNVGKLMACLVLGGMLIQPLSSYLSARFSKTLLQAMMASIGVLAAIAVVLAKSWLGLSVALFILGASTFSLYPIAISQACVNAQSDNIVAITEFMLISYSIGSIVGPLIADFSAVWGRQLPLYLAAILASTSLYMLLVAVKEKDGRGHLPPTFGI